MKRWLILMLGSDDLITDNELLSWMKWDERSLEDKKKLLPNTQGEWGIDLSLLFLVIYPEWQLWYQNKVWSTNVINTQKAINIYIMFLASLAMNDYNDEWGTKFQVKYISKVNKRPSYSSTYYITFGAWDLTTSGEQFFQAIVNSTCEIKQSVVSCSPLSMWCDVINEATWNAGVKLADEHRSNNLSCIWIQQWKIEQLM